VRPVLDLTRGRRRSRNWARASDADQLAQMTGVPAGVWLTVFGLVAVAALVLGAALLAPAGWHI
jgi:Peptidase M50B-like